MGEPRSSPCLLLTLNTLNWNMNYKSDRVFKGLPDAVGKRGQSEILNGVLDLKNKPIGIFDSGVGGLTVVRTLVERLPGESFIYFGDTAHVPYGTKTREQLFEYADDIITFLLSKDVKAIVVACGTHSSVTLPEMEGDCPVPLLGVVKAGGRAAVKATRNGKIGVIATQASVNSGSYARAIKSLDSSCSVFSTACGQFVPLVESGLLTGPAIRQAVQEYIQPLLGNGIDTLVMGCTHYPFLAPVIRDYVGPGVTLVDPAEETVAELMSLLEQKSLWADEGAKYSRSYYVSGNPEYFYKLGRMLVGEIMEKVTKLSLDKDSDPEEEQLAQHRC